MKFEINEKNKALWDRNFIKVESNEYDLDCCNNNGVYKKAELLNNDPDIQEFGAIVDISKQGYLHKDYKIFNPESKEPICFITKEPLKLYDVILLINGWEEYNSFVVFMGTCDNDTRYLFKYFHAESDTIRNYKPLIKEI